MLSVAGVVRLTSQSLFAAAVLALPLDVVLRSRFLGYNARLSHLLFGLFFLVTLAQAVRSSSWRTVRVPWPAVVFLVAVVASVPASLDPTKTAGYATWAVFDVAVFLVGLPLSFRMYPSLGMRAVGVHLLTAVVVCEIAFGELAALFDGGPRPPSAFVGTVMFPRLQALFYEPAYLAFFLLTPVAVALTWRLAEDGWPRRALIVVTILSSATIILSTSRSGWIALVTVYAVAAFVAARRSLRRRWVVREAALLLAASGLLAAVTMGTWVMAKTDGDPADRAGALGEFALQLASFGSGNGTGDDVGLRTSWSALGIRVWSEHPIFGVGIGGFGGYVVHQGYVPAIPDPSRIVVPDVWVELLAETGIVGAGAAFALVLWTAITALRRAAPPLVVGYGVALLVVCFVSLPFNSTFVRLDLWLVLGLATALCSPLAHRASSTVSSGSSVVLPART